MAASSGLLTLAEAADILQLSPQWIHQLLASGDLDGPSLPPGRLRFPPSAGRVYRSSLDDLLRHRAEQTASAGDAEDRGIKPARRSRSSASGREADRARAAAQELKV